VTTARHAAPSHRRAVVVALACVGLACVARPPRAGAAAFRVPENLRLRMEGYVGPPAAGRSEAADLTLRVGDVDRRFQVTKARVLIGDVQASEVFDAVRPYRPSFVLRGPRELLDRIAGATPGTRLVVSGEVVGGPSRDFLVAGVDGP